MLFIRNDIPAKVFSTDYKPIESLHVELKPSKQTFLTTQKTAVSNHIWTVFRKV